MCWKPRIGKKIARILIFFSGFIFSMSSDENVIAMPADNSIASESISAKLIEVSRVAESLDTALHETQDGMSLNESTTNAVMSPSTSSDGPERKNSSASNSDVRKKLSFVLLTNSA